MRRTCRSCNARKLDGTSYLYVCTHNLSYQHINIKKLTKMKCLQEEQPLDKVLESALASFAYSARP